MTGGTILRVAVIAAATCAFESAGTASVPPARTPVAWVPAIPKTSPRLADAMARVPRTAQPTEDRKAVFYAARGETAGYSVVVRAGKDPISSLAVKASALTCTTGACKDRSISPNSIDAYRVMYQVITHPSLPATASIVSYPTPGGWRPKNPKGVSGANTIFDQGANRSACDVKGHPYGKAGGEPSCLIPDGLVPYEKCADGSAPPCFGPRKTTNRCAVDGTDCGAGAPSMTIASNTNQQLWIEVTVPRGATEYPGGLYTGTVTLITDTGTANIAVALNLWDFELPVKPRFETLMGTNWQPGNYQSNEDMATMLAKHRTGVDRTGDASVHSYRARLDRLNTPFSKPEAFVHVGWWRSLFTNPCQENGFLSNAEMVKTFDAVDGGTGRTIGTTPYVYLCDECWKFAMSQAGCPDQGALEYSRIREQARRIHADPSASRIKTMAAVNPIRQLVHESEDARSGRPAIDIFVVVTALDFEEPGMRDAALAGGSRLFVIFNGISDPFGPKWNLDGSPVGWRAGFIYDAMSASGAVVAEFHNDSLQPWRVNYWRNPVESPHWASASKYVNGETWFYTGDQVGFPNRPVPHLRLKFWRDGLQDYDLIQILKTIRGGARYTKGECDAEVWPGKTCQRVVVELGGTDWSDWSTDTYALQRARKAIGDRIAADVNRPR